MEAVIKWVVSRQGALAFLLVCGSHFSSTVVHLSHLLQPLPSIDDRKHQNWEKAEQEEAHGQNGYKTPQFLVITWVYPVTSREWLHFLGPEPPQLPQYGGKAWGHAPFQALVTKAQGAVVNTQCLSARQTGTEPGKWKMWLRLEKKNSKRLSSQLCFQV